MFSEAILSPHSHSRQIGMKHMLGALLAIGYAALFLFLLRRSAFFSSPGLSRRAVGYLFLLKIAAGTALWFVYTYMHTDRATADIYKFFDSGNTMYAALWTNPGDYFRMLFGIANDSPYFDKTYYIRINHWYREFESNLYNDSHTMIRFNAFVRLFSFGHYHVHTVFICFLSTTGLVALYKAFVLRFKGFEGMLITALFLLPSVLFWASGVLKESLLLFGLGVFVWVLMELKRNGLAQWKALLIPFVAVLLFLLKFYVLLSMVPALIGYLWCRSTGDRNAFLKFGIVYVVFIALGLNSELFYPRFNILEVLWVKQRDFIGLARSVNAGSLVDVTPLEPNIMSFLSQAPHALYMTFLSPLTTWSNGALGLMSALENAALIAVFAAAFRWKRVWKTVDKPLLLFCVGYCLMLGLVIGWTTPVIGALVRYRVPLLPFLVMIAMCIADPARIPWPRSISKWMNTKAERT
jgi:hypothetical protein